MAGDKIVSIRVNISNVLEEIEEKFKSDLDASETCYDRDDLYVHYNCDAVVAKAQINLLSAMHLLDEDERGAIIDEINTVLSEKVNSIYK